MLLIILGAIERVVVDPSLPTFVRAYVWYRLLRHWASMRFDDSCWCSPTSLVMRARGLVGVLSRTKTSGADKSIAQLPIYVSKEAWVEEDWLTVGLELWQSDLYFPRDYLLCLPNEDFTGTCGKRARYADAQVFSRALLSSLRTSNG